MQCNISALCTVKCFIVGPFLTLHEYLLGLGLYDKSAIYFILIFFSSNCHISKEGLEFIYYGKTLASNPRSVFRKSGLVGTCWQLLIEDEFGSCHWANNFDGLIRIGSPQMPAHTATALKPFILLWQNFKWQKDPFPNVKFFDI